MPKHRSQAQKAQTRRINLNRNQPKSADNSCETTSESSAHLAPTDAALHGLVSRDVLEETQLQLTSARARITTYQQDLHNTRRREGRARNAEEVLKVRLQELEAALDAEKQLAGRAAVAATAQAELTMTPREIERRAESARREEPLGMESMMKNLQQRAETPVKWQWQHAEYAMPREQDQADTDTAMQE